MPLGTNILKAERRGEARFYYAEAHRIYAAKHKYRKIITLRLASAITCDTESERPVLCSLQRQANIKSINLQRDTINQRTALRRSNK